jgi:hypothetical protein
MPEKFAEDTFVDRAVDGFVHAMGMALSFSADRIALDANRAFPEWEGQAILRIDVSDF